jgi:N-acetylmuramoyl-L-alanine amidase
MGLLDNFKNPFGDALQRVSESQNELFKDVGKVIDASHITNNPFLEQLYGKNKSTIKDPNTILVNSRKDIVVVIDPGHGITLDSENLEFPLGKNTADVVNIGSEATWGYEIVTEDNIKVDKSWEELPSEILDDLRSRKVKFDGKCRSTNQTKIVRRISTYEKLNKPISDYQNQLFERVITFKIAEKLKDLLEKIGYNVILTRKNLKEDLFIYERVNIVNKLSADYLISIHLDGDCNATTEGCHTTFDNTSIYDKDYTQKQIEFATDILSEYNFALKLTKSNGYADGRNLGILKSKAKRKTLIELGFCSNPAEIARINENISGIAVSLAKGLEKNVMRNYRKKAFKVGKTIYYDEQAAIKADKIQQEEIFKRKSSIVSLKNFEYTISMVQEVEAPLPALDEYILLFP